MGYDRTRIAEIVRRAGVTRGSVSHHYRTKVGLFVAVFEEVCQEVVQAARTRMETAEGETWERFLASLGVLMEQAGQPHVQRIVYGGWAGSPGLVPRVPSVAGSPVPAHRPDAITGRGGAATVAARPVQPPGLGDVLRSGVLHCQAEEKAVARQEMTAVLRRLLDGLRLPQAAEDGQGEGG